MRVARARPAPRVIRARARQRPRGKHRRPGTPSDAPDRRAPTVSLSGARLGERLNVRDPTTASCTENIFAYSERNVAVGTTRQLIGAARGRWLARNVFQVCEGGWNRRAMRRDTVASLTTKPSLSSSPWMRGAPQPTLSRAISRMRVRISASVRGRPRRLRLVQLQYRANPLRCQRITVAGCTIAKAVRHSGHTRASTTQNARSARLSLGRFAWRRRTASSCRRARFSSASSRRDLARPRR
jgi:hypothetical protein